MYDTIVVGARCAGAATAMLLARRGLDVLLVDRASFPSEIPHGHLIYRHGPGRLARWGLLDRLLERGTPPITTATTDFGDYPMTATGLVDDGVPYAIAPRRSVLDEVLVQAAVQAGAELREGFAVLGPLTDGERVTGVRGRAGVGGAVVEEHATIVVGADGRNSGLA